MVASLSLIHGGCLFLAVGAAAGGGAAAGYYYWRGKLCRDYNANFNDVWAATHAALIDLGMPVESEGSAALSGIIHTYLSDGTKVRIEFDVEPNKIPAEGPLTHVGVRVATFGNDPVSQRILDQVEVHLTRAPVIGPPVPAAVPGQPTARNGAPGQVPAETAPPPLAPPQPIVQTGGK
jgi:hypothetical protein